MNKKDREFIIEIIEELIDWTSYAPDFFKEKHHLNTDIENAKKAIKMLKIKR